MAVKGYTFRLDDSIICAIDVIAEIETKKTGYSIDRSNVVRKLLVEYIATYNKE